MMAGCDRLLFSDQSLGRTSQYMEIAGRRCRVSFAGVERIMPAGCRLITIITGFEGLNRLPTSLAEEMARGMLFCMAENEFYLVGHKVRMFLPVRSRRMDRYRLTG